MPGSPTAEFNSYNSKTIVNTFSNYKAFSRDRKNHNLVSKKNFKEEIRLKNSMGLNKIKNIEEKRDSCENKNISKKNSNDNNNEKIPKIPRKVNSCQNIEDEILDQNFKNYLKNDENLKANLSRNNSYNSLKQNNNSLKNNKNYLNTYSNTNVNFFPKTTRIKEFENNEINNKEINKNIIIENALYEKYSKNLISNNENIRKDNLLITNRNNEENFERLKTDFFLLYSEKSLKNVNNEILFFELQLMIEKNIGSSK